MTYKELLIKAIHLMGSAMPEAYRDLGRDLDKEETVVVNGEEVTARDLFTRAIDYNSDLTGVYGYLAKCIFPEQIIELLDGREMNQVKLYRKAIDLEPEDPSNHFWLAMCLRPGQGVILIDGSRMSHDELLQKHKSLQWH